MGEVRKVSRAELAYRDSQQSRQPEIDALRAALDEAERALGEMLSFTHVELHPHGTQSACPDCHKVAAANAALARIREVKRDG